MNRNKIRITAICLSLIMLQNIVSPTLSFALRINPIQPEYSAYESIGSTDMVNLITGDFVYTMPILEVPSPEGGFALPLSYHAGIGLNAEASWVGLGWSLNAGAIARYVMQYPDDSKGNALSSNIQNSGGESTYLNFGLGTYTYDTQKGDGGSIGWGSVVSVGWGSNQSTTVMGVTFDSQYKNGVNIDPVGIASSLLTVASWGVGGPAAEAMKFVNKGIGYESIISSLSSGSGVSNADLTIFRESPKWNIFYQKFKYSLNVTRTESMYGSLYLGAQPMITLTPGSATIAPAIYNAEGTKLADMREFNPSNNPVSDFIMNVDDTHLGHVLAPTKIAYDNYSVMGTGVSGNIQPYHLDIGTLSYPNLGTSAYIKESFLDFLPPSANYKVNFKYAGDISNSYTNQLGTANTFPSAYNIVQSASSNSAYWFNLTLNDEVLYNSTKRIEQDRAVGGGLKNHHLAGSRNVEWFTNAEINGGTATSRGFIDFLSGESNGASSDRNDFRTRSTFYTIPQDGIGGFSITRGDGLTYHYALPVYNTRQITEMTYSSTSTTTNKLENTNPYAVTWLLTAITGSDFVDRGEIGVLDNNDWGYWVKMDYGNFSNNYNWHSNYFPYDGTYSSQDNSVKQNMHGNCESYYLNSISTRTHTALFIKDLRNDGKSAYYKCSNPALLINTEPSSSLKLNEIVLLKNEDLTYLKSYYGLSTNGSTGLTLGTSLAQSETLGNVIDKYDFYSTSGTPNNAMLTYIKSKQLRRIVFNYYTPGDPNELCKGSINSYPYSGKANLPLTDNSVAIDYSGNSGKLTLKSVSIQSSNNASIMPDYKFYYANENTSSLNPNYNKDQWDGWGMYKNDGASNNFTHQTTSADGTQWSLTRIVTPLGGEISVTHERDDYSSISGNANSTFLKIPFAGSIDNSNAKLRLPIAEGLSNRITVGQVVEVNAARYVTDEICPIIITTLGLCHTVNYVQTFIGNYTVSQVFSDGVILSGINPVDNWIEPKNPPFEPDLQHTIINTTISGYLLVNPNSKMGGDLRVSSIAVKDENGNQNVSQYVYTQDGTTTGTSSGVCAAEPEYCFSKDYSFYKLPDYPVTPIMYSKVTMYEKSIPANSVSTAYPNNTYLSKTEYNFVTPHQTETSTDANNMVVQTPTAVYDGGVPGHTEQILKMYNYNIAVNSSSVGNVTSIIKYNNKNQILNRMDYGYTDGSEYGNNMGKTTEGTMLCEKIYDDADHLWYHKLLRTTKIYNPSIPKSVTITEPGVTKTITNLAYDYLTGIVLSKETNNSFGEKYRTVSVPAYTQYASMGSKVDDINNKNMLTQEKENYFYRVEASGTTTLIGANVQTWNNNWNYRELLNSGTSYSTIVSTDNTFYDPTTNPYKPVWHPYQTFVWKSPVNADGTINPVAFQDYWANPANSGWQKTSEVTRYDHFSKPLEVKDINGNFVSSKMGYNESYAIASVANSNYTGFAYSGAEDVISGTNYFGGEVLGANQKFTKIPVNGYAHTGISCLKFEGGAGFQYKASVGDLTTADFKKGKTYRANVWMYNNPDAQFGALYCILRKPDNSVESSKYVNVASTSTKLAGNFYLLSLDIDIPAGSMASNIEVGAGIPPFSSLTQAPIIYFDDFRVHPVDAPMTSYVYDEPRGLVTAILDNENFATKFYYDNAGRLIRTDKETLQGFKKVSESAYHYGRQ